MTMPRRRPTGFATFTSSDPSLALRLADEAAERLGDARVIRGDDQTYLVLWGKLRHRDIDTPILLCQAARTRRDDVETSQITRLLENQDVEAANDVVPPFAAIEWDWGFSRFAIEVDWLGLRHIYLSEGGDWVGASSSASVLAAARGRRLNESALGIQAMLGWHLDLRTPFVGVTKLPPGSRITLSRGRVSREPLRPPAPAAHLGPDAAVPLAAHLLTEFVTNFLEDHPDAVVQLDGRTASRIILGAIPRKQRRSVEALTLALPGGTDLDGASRIVAEQGMKHRVIDLSGLGSLSPQRAYDLTLAAARDLECSADPLSFAAVAWAESLLDHRPRLTGLGSSTGEGTRLAGPSVRLRTRSPLGRTLTHARLKPGRHVDPGALSPAFAALALSQTRTALHHAIAAGGDSWLPAADEFDLWQRLHRWAGVQASATCFDRQVVNPMLDHAFVEIARGLRPRDKRDGNFLRRVLLELDPELAVTGRSHRSSRSTSPSTRPDTGAEILAAKVTGYWRSRPEELDFARGTGFLDHRWLDELIRGERTADSATVGFLLNLVAAGEAPPGITASLNQAKTF